MISHFQYLTRVLCVLCLFTSFTTEADWINLSGAETSRNIAEFIVEDNQVRVKLEIYLGDLALFDDLMPDKFLKVPALDSERSRLDRFSTKGLIILGQNGSPLRAESVIIEPRIRIDRQSAYIGMINPITQQRVSGAPADKRVMYAELVYPFEGNPKKLTIIPPSTEEGMTLANIGFIVYHKSVPVIDFRYLSSAATLNLNWEDPWYSKFDNVNLKRHHQSALMSYLYVEPYEVRHEILTRVKDMENWMDLGLRGAVYIEADELDGLRQRVGQYLLNKNPVLIDGKSLTAILDRTSFVQVSINGLVPMENQQRIEISSAMLGIIITYLTDELPKEVTVEWKLFSENIAQIPTTTIDPAGPLVGYITQDYNVQKWTNFLKKYSPPNSSEVHLNNTLKPIEFNWSIPVAIVIIIPLAIFAFNKRKDISYIIIISTLNCSLLVIGFLISPYTRVSIERPAHFVFNISNDETKIILHSLLKNIYRAFDFRDEKVVYEKLAISVEGDLLTDLYLQNRRSFAIKQAGGAQARVKNVELIEAITKRDSIHNQSYVVDAKWIATGEVGHWGHTHIRSNFYDAKITLGVFGDSWKIIDFELLEERRVNPGKELGLQERGNND